MVLGSVCHLIALQQRKALVSWHRASAVSAKYMGAAALMSAYYIRGRIKNYDDSATDRISKRNKTARRMG